MHTPAAFATLSHDRKVGPVLYSTLHYKQTSPAFAAALVRILPFVMELMLPQNPAQNSSHTTLQGVLMANKPMILLTTVLQAYTVAQLAVHL